MECSIPSGEVLDLRGVPCPQNVSRLLLELAGLETGTVLEVILDSGEPYDNVMESLTVEGLKVSQRVEDNPAFKRLRVIAK
ncbi:MAG: sulfurtransferase TusA family protein [Proteobacteria bacterium]|nr:sulfurtransferase TusA family protein [Pseudomonadota bacterium]NBY18665.1 sulfurtransferase TusA family protein [bacterium]